MHSSAVSPSFSYFPQFATFLSLLQLCSFTLAARPYSFLYFSTVADCIRLPRAESSLIPTILLLLHDAASGGCLLSYYRSLRTFGTRTASHGGQNSTGASPRLALSYTALTGRGTPPTSKFSVVSFWSRPDPPHFRSLLLRTKLLSFRSSD